MLVRGLLGMLIRLVYSSLTLVFPNDIQYYENQFDCSLYSKGSRRARLFGSVEFCGKMVSYCILVMLPSSYLYLAGILSAEL